MTGLPAALGLVSLSCALIAAGATRALGHRTEGGRQVAHDGVATEGTTGTRRR